LADDRQLTWWEI